MAHNDVNNVCVVAQNAKRINVIVPSRSYSKDGISIAELYMLLACVDQVEVFLVFDHHCIDFKLDTNTIQSFVYAKS